MVWDLGFRTLWFRVWGSGGDSWEGGGARTHSAQPFVADLVLRFFVPGIYGPATSGVQADFFGGAKYGRGLIL